MTAREFAQAARPHSWMLVADNLYQQSIALYHRFPSGKTTQKDGSGSVLGEWQSSNRSTFLLAGFALENAIKAFLVYEHPQWVSNGVLARPLRSHELVALSKNPPSSHGRSVAHLSSRASNRAWNLGRDTLARLMLLGPKLSRTCCLICGRAT
jgi:hypothetical protein